MFGHDERARESNSMGLDPSDQREFDAALQILRAKLYPDVLASAWQHGRAISPDQALAEVIEEFHPRGPAHESALHP
jgi:hypothetical protein